MSEQNKKDTPEPAVAAEAQTDPGPAPPPAKSNGTAGAVPAVALGESPRLSRFVRYFNRPVGIQLKTPLIALDFCGQYMEVEDERYGLLDLALLRNEKGQAEAVGMSPFLPRVILHASSDGEYLVAWITSPTTGAVIECNLDPDQVEYVIFCARTPREQRIITPGTLS